MEPLVPTMTKPLEIVSARPGNLGVAACGLQRLEPGCGRLCFQEVLQLTQRHRACEHAKRKAKRAWSSGNWEPDDQNNHPPREESSRGWLLHSLLVRTT